MKLLMMSPSFPSPTLGGGIRNYHLLKMKLPALEQS